MDSKIIDQLVENAFAFSQIGIMLTYSEPQKDVPYTKTFPLILLNRSDVNIRRSNGDLEVWSVAFMSHVGLIFEYQPGMTSGFGVWIEEINDYRVLVTKDGMRKDYRLSQLLELNGIDSEIFDRAEDLNAKAKEIYDRKLGRNVVRKSNILSSKAV